MLPTLGLPTGYDADAFDELLATMAVDKKTRGSTLRFVILDGLARPAILAGPTRQLLRIRVPGHRRVGSAACR